MNSEDIIAMIHQAFFRNFRGFESLELSKMENITLISGRNNSGKSSVLEGIFLALDYRAAESFALLNDLRGISYNVIPEDLWNILFHNLSIEEEIGINFICNGQELRLSYARDDSFITSSELKDSKGILKQLISSSSQSYSLAFNFSYSGFVETGHFIMNQQSIHRYSKHPKNRSASIPFVQYIHSSRALVNNLIAELFSTAVFKGKKNKLINNLKSIDSSIDDVTTLAMSNSQPQLYANVKGKWLPFRLAGDGFDHMLLLIASMIAHPNSVILVDEIETGFHYSAYNKLWEAVITTAREEHCQVIATTHSYECIESAANQAGIVGAKDEFCYFRLGKDKQGNPKAYRFSQEILSHATESNMEVR